MLGEFDFESQKQEERFVGREALTDVISEEDEGRCGRHRSHMRQKGIAVSMNATDDCDHTMQMDDRRLGLENDQGFTKDLKKLKQKV